MERKIEVLLSEGLEILSEIDKKTKHTLKYEYIECKCIPMCEPVNGYMILYTLEKDAKVSKAVNKLCKICEKLNVVYQIDCYYNKDKTVVMIWVPLNKESIKRFARRVTTWNSKVSSVTNIYSEINLDEQQFIEAIKYNQIQILSVFPQQLN